MRLQRRNSTLANATAADVRVVRGVDTAGAERNLEQVIAAAGRALIDVCTLGGTGGLQGSVVGLARNR